MLLNDKYYLVCLRIRLYRDQDAQQSYEEVQENLVLFVIIQSLEVSKQRKNLPRDVADSNDCPVTVLSRTLKES